MDVDSSEPTSPRSEFSDLGGAPPPPPPPPPLAVGPRDRHEVVSVFAGTVEFRATRETWTLFEGTPLATAVGLFEVSAGDAPVFFDADPAAFARCVNYLRGRARRVSPPADDEALEAFRDLAEKLGLEALAADLEVERLRRDWESELRFHRAELAAAAAAIVTAREARANGAREIRSKMVTVVRNFNEVAERLQSDLQDGRSPRETRTLVGRVRDIFESLSLAQIECDFRDPWTVRPRSSSSRRRRRKALKHSRCSKVSRIVWTQAGPSFP